MNVKKIKRLEIRIKKKLRDHRKSKTFFLGKENQ